MFKVAVWTQKIRTLAVKMQSSSRRQCATVGCSTNFEISPSTSSRKYCLICELSGVAHDSEKTPHVKTVCQVCDHDLSTCSTPFSSDDQPGNTCYWCYAAQCLKSHKSTSALETASGSSEHKSRASLQLFVKSLTGKTISVTSNEDALIYEVMEQIEKDEHIPKQFFQLIFAGKMLQPHKTVSNYNIQKESTLHLVSNLRGS
jgi:hypothetical protein